LFFFPLENPFESKLQNYLVIFRSLGRIKDMLSGSYWIGANSRREGEGWRWTDGSAFAFMNWKVGKTCWNTICQSINEINTKTTLFTSLSIHPKIKLHFITTNCIHFNPTPPPHYNFLTNQREGFQRAASVLLNKGRNSSKGIIHGR